MKFCLPMEDYYKSVLLNFRFVINKWYDELWTVVYSFLNAMKSLVTDPSSDNQVYIPFRSWTIIFA